MGYTVLYLSPLDDEFKTWVHLTDGLQTNGHDWFVILFSKCNLMKVETEESIECTGLVSPHLDSRLSLLSEGS